MNAPERLLTGSLGMPGFRYDFAQRELRDDHNRRVELRAQTVAVLDVLARHAGSLVERAELMDEVWRDLVVTDDSLVQCIVELRRALGDHRHERIRTISKRGYRLDMAADTTADERTQADDEDLAAFTQQVGFATTADGVRIAYAVAGDPAKPALVRCSHWLTHIDWDWRCPIAGGRLRTFARHFRLVRFDARGCGKSQRDVPQATLDQTVLDLEAVVEAAALDRFVLLGPSGGGAQAIRYAARHPGRVTRLILFGAFARGPLERGPDSESVEQVNALAQLFASGWAQDNPAFRQILTTMMFPGASREQAETFNHMQRVSCTAEGVAELQQRIVRYNAADDLPQVRCPTLVLHNPADVRVPFAEAQLMANRIPGAILRTFAGTNHVALPGDPAYASTLRTIIDFALGRPA